MRKWFAWLLAVCCSVSAATVCPPPLSIPYANSVVFDLNAKRFDFRFTGGTQTLVYSFGAASGPMLSSLAVSVSGSLFTPSNGGGVSVVSGGSEHFPWSSGVSYRLAAADTARDTVRLSWIMKYGADSLHVRYAMNIAGRTLTVHVSTDEPLSAGFYCDRCAHAADPVIVHVPYLTLFNVLLSGGVFTSLYCDWENSDASLLTPSNSVFSDSSVYFAQNALYVPNSAGRRRPVNETVYCTVSPDLNDVLPQVPNPVSPYKAVSAGRLFVDLWTGQFSQAADAVARCRKAGVADAWVIEHNWQHAGYDMQYPDVLPANPNLGGNAGLLAVRDSAAAAGYLFGVHENYVDMYPDAPSYSIADIALTPDDSLKKAWYNSSTGKQSYQIKPSRAAFYLDTWAPKIHAAFSTSASFLDVHSAVNPGDKNDYDAAVDNSGMFRETMRLYRDLGGRMRTDHAGPVSGEGNCHFINSGYFDDFEAQVNCAACGPRQGYALPVFPDFKLGRLHRTAAWHGVGYYERFFSDSTGASVFSPMSSSQVLTYVATELAYGNAGFIATPSRIAQWDSTVRIENRYVLPAQKVYCLDSAVSIQYDDNGILISASDFIRNHPATYADINSGEFMSRVRVEYARGMVVYVNRHPSLPWTFTAASGPRWNDFHATVGGRDSLSIGVFSNASWTLPPKNGWLVTAPEAVAKTATEMRNHSLPGFTMVVKSGFGSGKKIIEIIGDGSSLNSGMLSIITMDGRVAKQFRVPGGRTECEIEWDGRWAPPGIYFARVRIGGREIAGRFVITR
jgi:hypothetical protein